MIRHASMSVFAALLSLSLLPGSTYALEGSYAETTTATELMSEDLASDPAYEVKAQLYTIPANTTLPWHTHPGAQEIVYVLRGPFIVEVEGEGETKLATGGNFHLAPDLVHRGRNPSTDHTAKLYVVRIKPKDAPLVKEVDR
ncbi:cupin domain-containing protein [Methyloligella sp. 2.7D]|uniref:cupin domain-containing protein n=1 Tax=unclassified Methyloligella TaxID=2625955 RepID=UPI00157DD859|nr:cupin domain-containing protein [Methyloligella sp. GL2]QKP76381.1 cupin domain-containing protein [Methyloligella sp. GL2]